MEENATSSNCEKHQPLETSSLFSGQETIELLAQNRFVLNSGQLSFHLSHQNGQCKDKAKRSGTSTRYMYLYLVPGNWYRTI
jgi:hypothetical protein